jgi:hypothetical protein
MRKLSPQRRRVAVICASCAAIIPSTTLLMHGSHANGSAFAGGLIVGLAITLSVGSFIGLRRSCL